MAVDAIKNAIKNITWLRKWLCEKIMGVWKHNKPVTVSGWIKFAAHAAAAMLILSIIMCLICLIVGVYPLCLLFVIYAVYYAGVAFACSNNDYER